MAQYINPDTGETVHRDPGQTLPYGGGVWQPVGGAGSPLQSGASVPQSYRPMESTTQSFFPETGSSMNTGMSDTYELGRRLAENPAFTRFVRWCAAAVGVVILVLIVLEIGTAAYESFDRQYRADHVNKPTVYTATELWWTSKWPWAIGKPRYMSGENAVVTGNVDNLYLSAYGNLTMEGDVSNSRLVSTGTITVGNVSNTTMTAHKIVITGHAVNVKQIILRPLRYIPLPRPLH